MKHFMFNPRFAHSSQQGDISRLLAERRHHAIEPELQLELEEPKSQRYDDVMQYLLICCKTIASHAISTYNSFSYLNPGHWFDFR